MVIPDCGHLPHEEQSEAFLLAVRKFLKSVAQENPDLGESTHLTRAQAEKAKRIHKSKPRSSYRGE